MEYSDSSQNFLAVELAKLGWTVRMVNAQNVEIHEIGGVEIIYERVNGNLEEIRPEEWDL